MKARPLRKQAPQQRGEAGLVELAIRDGDHGVVERFARRHRRIDASHLKAEERRCDAGAFVAVHEGLRRRDVKGVSRCDAENVRTALVEVIPWLADRALESSRITDAIDEDVISAVVQLMIETALDDAVLPQLPP